MTMARRARPKKAVRQTAERCLKMPPQTPHILTRNSATLCPSSANERARRSSGAFQKCWRVPTKTVDSSFSRYRTPSSSPRAITTCGTTGTGQESARSINCVTRCECDAAALA